ncbi:DUF3427 domain-containing protein [Peribacillus huizhouensis]|uniref:Protein NO VEIN C-terminal domain-containing protein n=1 Tax=Peribacillus huizhouensis TaxID=1501239 RepID=A0ABR6CRE8_9BACI|nr:DUF3427 domain-containing protein [Peribacillus huizhouensis]MBA9027603.1 hypothetical protein [Peribacillus huizhouensis]
MSIKRLNLYDQYSRDDVYKIFDGVTPFTIGAGNWGLHGLVKIPKRKKDFVFFVTFGQKQLGHDFDESITEDGILTWQSQPKQTLDNKVIKQLISHNHLIENIYLFLRTKKKNSLTKQVEPFTYLGRLAYLTHDTTREQPVYFKWQIIDWEVPPSNVLDRMDLTLEPLINQEDLVKDHLVETQRPSLMPDKAKESRSFYATKVDYAENSKRNSELGLKGELLVVNHLKNVLGYDTIHTSVIEGDGAGYDIEAFKEDGTSLYIEVKTTKGGINTPFIITANELAFSLEYTNNYELYRVYEYDHNSNSGKFYRVEGDLKDSLNLKPTVYRAKL